MILLAFFAAAISTVPAMKLGPTTADGTVVVLILDSKARIATRVGCLKSEWSNPADAAAKLMASTKVMATVLAKDGRLTDLEDLGPAKYECVLLPDASTRGRP